MKEASFYIEQMSCAACSSGIERALKRKHFIQSIQVHLLSKKAHICYDEAEANIDDIFALIRKMGYEPHFGETHTKTSQKADKNGFFARLNAYIESFDNAFLTPMRRLIISIVASIIVLLCSWGEMLGLFHLPFLPSYLIMLCLTLVVMHLGRGFYIRGFKALFMRNPNMDSLIAIGTLSAFLYSLQGLFGIESHSYFDSVCVIITLVLVGKHIERDSKQDALDSASMLLSLHQKQLQRVKINTDNINLLSNAPCENIIAQDAKIGDVLKILPGEMIMVDCNVISGESSLDTAAINGESIPILARKNDAILSGSVNLESVLYVRVEKNAKESALAHIVALIQKAQESKAPIALLADKVAGVFVPIVIVLASLAGVFWWGMRDLEFGLSIFVATLVISCPCALGLATPMAILHAQSVANKMGVFFKSAKSLQTLGQITHIVFDKTGTLTQGLSIEKILCFDKTKNEQELFDIALTLESTSSHIIAKAFETHPLHKNATIYPIQSPQNIIGRGIKGVINDVAYTLGNAALMSTHLAANLPQNEDKITLYLATEEALLAQFSLQDFIKPDAREMITHFSKIHINSTILSGDNTMNTQKIANALGINEAIANASPEDKMRLLQDLVAHHKVLMVGDGINDAPALALAHTSAAFTSPNDIATQSADIIIYNHRAMSIYNAYALAKATISNIKRNLGFAFCYNVAFIPLAMGVLGGFGIFLHPMFCALAMSLSSLSVILSASRLKYFKIL